ncbi:MAG: hypothetical protein FJW88_03305 [Actinobacteria bacterium]|nr:hypothetical protein [Actinomycetota bacterium]
MTDRPHPGVVDAASHPRVRGSTTQVATTTSDGGITAIAARIVPSAGARRVLGWVLPLGLLACAVLVWPFPATLGVIVNGALVGGRVALIALGIALVYRANRVINFSAGDLGQVPTMFAVLCVLTAGFPYWLGAATGLVAALLVGAVVEMAIIRRFFTSPRLILTVATIGVSQVLIALALWMPSWPFFGDLTTVPRLDSPFEFKVQIGGTNFFANDLLTALAVPVCLIALGLFMKRSAAGTAIRGAAERADRAFTLGIPVHRLHTIVWVIATVLSFVAMWLRAGAVGLPIGEVLSPFFLIQALAAVVIGRMEHLPTIVVAAIGIGIVDQAMTFQPGNKPAYNDAVLFLIVLVALLVTHRPAVTRAGDVSTWRAVREIRPIPRELASLGEVRWAKWGGVALLATALVALPLWLSESRINLAAVIVVFGIVGVSLVVLTGWAGQVSLGQMAFAGIGAAIGGAITADLGWDLGIALLLGGVAGGLIAMVIGYPAIRRRGLTLAVITLAFALLTSSYLLNRDLFERFLPGSRIERPDLFGVISLQSETSYYYFCLIALLLMYLAARGVRSSRTGRALIGIRENEPAARAYGISATRTTLAAFAMSGFIAAFAGVLLVHHQNGLGIAVFLPEESLQVFSMVVIGGMGSLPGALLGATYVRGAQYFLPSEWQFLATGAGLLLVLLVMPGGIGAALAKARDSYLRWVAQRRRLIVPSLLADRRAEDTALPDDLLEVAAEAAEAATVGKNVP